MNMEVIEIEHMRNCMLDQLNIMHHHSSQIMCLESEMTMNEYFCKSGRHVNICVVVKIDKNVNEISELLIMKIFSPESCIKANNNLEHYRLMILDDMNERLSFLDDMGQKKLISCMI